MPDIHSLLKRQLKKAFGDNFLIPEGWKDFIAMVDSAYRESDKDRYMLERSLDLSSQELFETNSEMRAIFEAIPDLLFRVDHEGTILECKTGNSSDLYFAREKLINRKIIDIPISSVSRAFTDAIDTVIATKGPATTEYSLVFSGDEHFFEARFIPLANKQIIIMVRNLTQRRRAEKALIESEEKYRSIVEESHVGVYIIQDGIFRFVNPTFCEIHGYAHDEIVNKMGPRDFIVPGDDGSVENGLDKRAGNDNNTSELIYRIRRKDGEIRTAKAMGSKIIYMKRPAIIGTLLDISKEKALEAQLLQSQKLETVGRLAGGIAHDFNNMLGVILGNVQMAKINLSSSEQTYEFCEAIEKATNKAADFVKQLLAFSRRQVLELKTFDLNRPLSGFEKMIHRVIGENIEMGFVLTEGLPPVRADETQINQVLLNLVVNARDAMPQGGILTIATGEVDIDEKYAAVHPDTSPGEYVMFSVADTGSGMEKDVAEKMFEPFFTTKTLGSGLGLSVVYGIIKQHGGFIEVMSEKGRGTTIKVFLPCADDAAPATVDPHVAVETGNETILIVEDDQDFRRVEAQMLTRLGYRVLTAADGLEGISVFDQKKDEIDLVILDVVMPRMSGRDALEGIRRIRPDVPYLFITGYSLDGIHVDYILDKGIEAIQKPFSFEILSRKIREIIEKSRAKEHPE